MKTPLYAAFCLSGNPAARAVSAGFRFFLTSKHSCSILLARRLLMADAATVGLTFEKVWAGLMELREEQQKTERVIAVEVKSKPLEKDIDEHVGRTEVLRGSADKRHDQRILRGAIAGAIMSKAVRDYVLKTGLYVIEQSGDSVSIDIPEGFMARDW
jgi:hypothetical protein